MIKTGVIQNGDGDAVPRRNPWLMHREPQGTQHHNSQNQNGRGAFTHNLSIPQFSVHHHVPIVPLGSIANFINHVGHILAEWKEPPISSPDVA